MENILFGLQVALSPINFVYCLVGVTLGTLIGVLPGVGPLVTISVLLPLTFGLPPEAAIIMIAGIYYGAAYGGSTTAILVNIPGETSAVVTCLDGHAMTRQGRAGPALAIAAIGSFIAGCFGTVLIALLAPPLTAVALKFGPAEYFSMTLMALILTSALTRGSVVKTIATAFLGVFLGLVGTDPTSGTRRFTFGQGGLADGIDFVVIAMGMFAVTDIIVNLNDKQNDNSVVGKIGSLFPSIKDFKDSASAIVRGTLLGSLLGLLPGAGQAVSSFLSYALEKRVNKNRDEFGNGAIAGVAGPEAANNAAAQTAFIPTLTLGIPGSATMALVIGALMIQGVAPGPRIMVDHPGLFWGLIVSMWIGNFLLVILNLPLVGVWVKLLKVPYDWMYPSILMFVCIGVYSIGGSIVDIYMTAAAGLFGWLFVKFKCEPAPLILGFILGPMVEDNFRRAMILSDGDLTTIVREPLSLSFVLASVTVLFLMVRSQRRKTETTPREAFN